MRPIINRPFEPRLPRPAVADGGTSRNLCTTDAPKITICGWSTSPHIPALLLDKSPRIHPVPLQFAPRFSHHDPENAVLLHLRGLVSNAAAAALAACCLAATACGSVSSTTAAGAIASSAGAVPRASSTQDPLAGLTATDIEVKVFNNFKAATSLKWDGTLIQQGGATHSDVALTSQRQSVLDGASYPGALESCAGTARFTSSDGKDTLGSYRFFVRPSDVYVSPDATYWSRTSGLGSGKSYSLIAGKYVQFTPNGHGDLEYQVQLLCDRQMLIGFLNTTGTLTRGAVTTFDGTRVVPIKDSGDLSETTEYVTDTSRPEIVKLSWHLPDGSADGKYTFTAGSPVTVGAPQPAQVIPAASLGM